MVNKLIACKLCKFQCDESHAYGIWVIFVLTFHAYYLIYEKFAPIDLLIIFYNSFEFLKNLHREGRGLLWM
jgi:hypothetical protein